MDKASASGVITLSDEPISALTIKHSEYVSETFIREGGAILTNKYLKKRAKAIPTENAGCNYCGWRCKSNNLNETKIKLRLHKKVCPNQKK